MSNIQLQKMVVVLLPRGSSTLYEVYHDRSGVTFKRMRINNQTMMRARSGEENYEKNVAMAFRRLATKTLGYDPWWIEFDELEFEPIQALDAVP